VASTLQRTLIDWSRWQDDDRTTAFPDLAKATANGVDGHMFRAGRGHDLDPDFARFVAEARRVKRPWGAYWWPEPCLSSPTEQARLTWTTVRAAGRPQLPLEVDVEGHRGEKPGAVAAFRPLSPGELATWLRSYIDELRRLSGGAHISIYTADWYWDAHVAPAPISFADCDLHVAHYLPGTPPEPAAQWSTWIGDRRPDMPKGWTVWSAWQFSAEHNGAGPTYGAESADLDLNVVRDDAWRRWTASGTPVPEAVVEVAVAKLPEVRAGMTGQQTRIVQALVNVHLAAAGRPLIAEDGRWSPSATSATGKALVWFQDRNGLAADGKVGRRTWSALLGLPPDPPG